MAHSRVHFLYNKHTYGIIVEACAYIMNNFDIREGMQIKSEVNNGLGKAEPDMFCDKRIDRVQMSNYCWRKEKFDSRW